MIKDTIAVYRSSFREMRRLKAITMSAMLMALSIILGYFTITAGPFLKIGLSTLVNQFVCLLFGPVLGAVYEGCLDIIKYVVRPTGPFFFGFTFNAILSGLLYGSLYYRKPFTFKRVLAVNLINCLIVNVGFNTLWISMLYGKAFMAILPMRLVKNLIQAPVNAVLFYFIVNRLSHTGLMNLIRGEN